MRCACPVQPTAFIHPVLIDSRARCNEFQHGAQGGGRKRTSPRNSRRFDDSYRTATSHAQRAADDGSHTHNASSPSPAQGQSVVGLEAVRRLRPAPCMLAQQGQARAHRRARPVQRKKTRQAGAERRRAVGSAGSVGSERGARKGGPPRGLELLESLGCPQGLGLLAGLGRVGLEGDGRRGRGAVGERGAVGG